MAEIHDAMLNAISAWIDEHNSHKSDEAQLWGRTAKLWEERGEVMEAMVGYTNQNPRKGQTHTLEDVRKELLDVALTAVGAVAHIDGNVGRPLNALAGHINAVWRRAGIGGERGQAP